MMADHSAAHHPAVIEVHLHFPGPGHHVAVGEDIAPGVDDDPGALAHLALSDHGRAFKIPELALKGGPPEEIIRNPLGTIGHHPHRLDADH